MEGMKSYLGSDGLFLMENGQIDVDMLEFTEQGRFLKRSIENFIQEQIMAPSIYNQIFTVKKCDSN